MALFSCCSSGTFVGLMVIWFWDQLNWKSLTMSAPMVLLSRPTVILPGCFQDSSITPKLLFPHPNPPEGGPSTHESCVYRIISVRVLVRLTSPRTCSSRHGVGRFSDWVQLSDAQGFELVGSGNILMKGMLMAVGICLVVGSVAPSDSFPTAPAGSCRAGAPVTGSMGKPMSLCPFVWFAAEAGQAASAVSSPV